MTTALLDTKLLSDFRQGDRLAFKKVFAIYYPQLLFFASRLTSSEDEAEDITSTAFLKLFRMCANFETEINIKAFLYITVRNASLSYLRSVKTRNEHERRFSEYMQNDVLFEYEYKIHEELLDKVKAAIETLPPKCRTIFKMMYYDEMSPEEIAAALEVSPSTVYNHKQYALKALRLSLGENSLALAWVLYLIISTKKEMASTLHLLSL